MKLVGSVVLLALFALAGYPQLGSPAKKSPTGFGLVDKSGNIRKPAGYREHYESFGAYSVVDPKSGAEELHYTWASPGTAEYYRKTGNFPDGAVLVKETFATDHGPMTTGEAHWATTTGVWFVMIKDSKGRFPGNPLWSDGWGWALFKPDAPDKQVATSFTNDCKGCHIPASSTDWVYVQGYPVLSSP
ncbi:MAG TPA: cytochrome P460 family protein [Candidatus Eisenbacteria bacterium]|nr:cytochrome P460 family protein [Candidatus Eisenbacteria bacterium]